LSFDKLRFGDGSGTLTVSGGAEVSGDKVFLADQSEARIIVTGADTHFSAEWVYIVNEGPSAPSGLLTVAAGANAHIREALHLRLSVTGEDSLAKIAHLTVDDAVTVGRGARVEVKQFELGESDAAHVG
jgi:hypothetical protein